MTARRRPPERRAPGTAPPDILLGSPMKLQAFVPAKDLLAPSLYPPWFVIYTSCRKLQMIARAEWIRLTGAEPPSQAWAFTYPHDDCSKGLRDAGLRLAASLVKQ